MANQPSGALWVFNPVRPNDLDDNYPSAFAIDVKGGHHMYRTLDERNAIKEGRREWGMLCTVYDDGNNNGIYQLVYKAFDDIITENQNWKKFSSGPPVPGGPEGPIGTIVGEWLPSVTSIVDTPPGVTPSDGTRYLIGTPSYQLFAPHPSKIVEWNSSLNSGSGDWVVTIPTNGVTIRVDNQPNTIWKFSGTWSDGGVWQKEYFSQIRYIKPSTNNGLNYTFVTPTGSVPLDMYSYSVYYANFNATNSGSSTLQIDNLGAFSMKKLSGNSLLDLSANDLIPNVQYHLSWNNGNFQVLNLGGAAGASSGVIGPPESSDGTYNDGLFTDFTPSTPIGTPIDRFNEILKALVPAPAPDLNSWSLSGPSFVSGKLSFDSTNALGFGLSQAPGVLIGGDFNVNTPDVFTKGINSATSQGGTDPYYKNYVGTLNSGVATSPQTPTPAFSQNAFGNGITGSLVMKLNGVTVSNINLSSSLGPLSDITNGSGITVTAATNSKFSSGQNFDLFWWRTGSYTIAVTDPRLKNGYNFLDLSHILPSSTITLPTYKWVSDPSKTATTFNSTSILNILGNTPKWISGIKYWQVMSLNFRTTIQNHVNTTYAAGNALSSSNNSPSGNNPIVGRPTTNSGPAFVNPSSTSIATPTNINSSQTVTWNYSSLNGSIRRLLEPINFVMNVSRTVQNADTTTYQEGGFLLDTYPDINTDTTERFTSFFSNSLGETSKISGTTITTRLRNGIGQYLTTFDSVSGLSLLAWDNTKSLYSDANHNNGLQVVGGELVYPRVNFGLTSSAEKNPNYNDGTNVNYFLSNQTTNGYPVQTYRMFTRVFRIDPNSNFALLKLNVFYTSGTSFVKVGSTLGQGTLGNALTIEVKLPYDSTRTAPSPLIGGAVTGWMDMTQKFIQSENYANGSGAFTGTLPGTSGGDWILDFGLRGTNMSGGYVIVRITAPQTWTGAITRIDCNGYVPPT